MTEFTNVSEHPDIISLQQKCAIGYFYLMIFNILLSAGMAWALLPYGPFFTFMLILLCVHIFGLIIIYRKPLHKWKAVAVLLILLVMIALIPVIIIGHVMGNVTPYFWMIVPPLAYYVIYPDTKTNNLVIFFGAIIFLLLTILAITYNMMIPLLAPLFKDWLITVATHKLPLTGILSMVYPIVSVPVFIFFFLFYMLKIAEAKAMIMAGNGVRGYDAGIDRADENSIEKIYELYDSIVEYFVREKPYLDPNFSIAQLSIQLNSNNSYISRAIKLKRDMSFTTFVNSYRIEKVKELIRNSRDLYTIEHIYTSAGFANQSTFNKAFKQIEGVTPSEYATK
ncbi:MAG: helix-turn-helix domain-containing protein [Tannerellaceae bacterium]|jgi:AraC-like DNA-binding protein|nr:helix-turn-helix domain-containing protein [Tannerellaceae bacterium]